ncbi:MAG: hypothetical protein JGK24_26565 [Microcoleus sp. PH2017_29_MFU_D_A]|uniref:hypothetical protein n=1 Tax=unclassified Microcoleus TaxID=2642155 RepID=UPI001D37E4D7|nr:MULTISPECIES: hypothetical protein [unclassified Microcoleus]MCC3416510.1 hypothetical protein [Microcoleus sp. PH2017_07_MST_O_A]MCC3507814.1 hypothetical protein [Microcoleus sp. PH2017_17_BER_D_A]TAE09636.1 MAG: hypothetical protein EAZ94_21460 [Oscillatoriales cyanobacterium]MCC3452817.1 hypothetical protein [Microcoleus sp. PH2017_08_TRC_O_A]MCC3491248.1 hypothetical protein [Microcoleus sp. PH2017_16_JOR_D_A]
MPNPSQESMPKLPYRRDNGESFFTYFVLASYNSRSAIRWQNSAELKRNFELYQERNQELSQLCSQPDRSKNIAEFWRQIAIDAPSQIAENWEPNNRKRLALEHLASYFEKSCYYAAIEVWSQSKVRPWEEYLYCPRVFIYNFDNLLRLLKSYNISHQTSLDTYVKQSLIKFIRSELGIGKFSRWRLLAKKSDPDLQQALERAGYREPDISQIKFARKYFKQVYYFNKVNNPAIRQRGQKWLDADIEDFQAAAKCYNAEKFLPSAPHEVSAGGNISAEKMQDWMKRCILALQNYPNFINYPQYLEELPEGERDKLLGEPDVGKPPIYEIESTDNQAWKNYRLLDSAFREKLETFQPEQHKILLLYYGAGFKQKELEIRLGVDQTSISRKVKRMKIQLLETLGNLSEPHQWVAEYVVGWLKKDFRAPHTSEYIPAALVQAIGELDSQQQEVLRLRYGQELAEENIADRLGMNLLELAATISKAQHKLLAKLIKLLNVWETEYVEKWLVQFYKPRFLAACRALNLSINCEVSSQVIDAIVQQFLETLTTFKKGE